MAVRAVLFDLGDTLVRLGPLPTDIEARLAAKIAARCQVPAPVCEQMAAAIAHAVAEAMREASVAPAHEEVSIPALVEAHLRTEGLAHGPDVFADIADAYGEADLSRIFEVPGRAVFLERLRRQGLALAVVSNTSTRGDLLTGMLDRFGILGYFDALVYSSEVGLRKPHPEIYGTALRQLGVAPQQAVFVGDRLRQDVLGPAAVGMVGVLTQEFWRDPHNGEPFAVISRLEELEGVIGSLNGSTPSGARGR